MDLKGAWIRNIYNVCSDGNETKESCKLRVNIPHYQRPYKWGEEQIENLYNDYFNAKSTEKNRENRDGYFIGSIVMVKDDIEEYYDVVDGQQRLTTVFLLNYVKFLILRGYIEEKIENRKTNVLQENIKNLVKCYSQLIGNHKTYDMKKMNEEIESILEEMTNDSSEENEKQIGSILEKYQKMLILPEKNFTDMEAYSSDYVEKMTEFWAKEEIALKYSRTSYNEKLKKALCNCFVKVASYENPEFVNTYRGDDEIVKHYISVIKCIFDETNKGMDKKVKPIEHAKNMIKCIDNMLDNLKFCVIITGNEKDAYTLFEVLNDRAYGLDDLELVKNLFFKNYCNNTSDGDERIDKNIEELDTIWGEQIFEPGTTERTIGLTAYLGVVYLTGNTDMVTKKQERYRKIIEKDYFNKYYNPSEKKYEYVNIKNDIMIFRLIRILIDEFDLKKNTSIKDSIKAECSDVVSITYKAMHLLNAFPYDAVMPAISNMIIKAYVEKSKKVGEKIPDSEKFREYVRKIKDDRNNEKEEFAEIHECSFAIWKMVLADEKYELSREYAKKIIAKVNYKKDDTSCIDISDKEVKKMKEKFIEWTDKWKYGNRNLNHKVKVLMIDLFRTEKHGDRLIYKPLQHTFTTEKLQLDHLEAKRTQDDNKEKYFKPSDTNDSRDGYINTLGNFMILDSDNNNYKNNVPLYNALGYYENMGSHWLLSEIKDLLENDNYSKAIKIEGSLKPHWIPKEQFFNERKHRIQKYFYTILTRDIHDKEAKIADF